MIRCNICDREFGSQEAIDSHNRAKHSEQNLPPPSKLRIKKASVVGLILLLLIGVAAYSFAGHKPLPIDGNAFTSQESFQTAQLSVSGAKYILQPSTFKKNIPVKIIANTASMPGCSKSVTIPAFGVSKFVDPEDNTIVFTPTKSGTFKIACSMNMYKGAFTVE